MSLFRRIELGLIALLLLSMVGLSGYSMFQRSKIADLKQDYSLATGRADAASTALDEYRKLNKDKVTAHANLDQALDAHPEYRDGVVPDDVAAVLRHPSGAARAVPR